MKVRLLKKLRAKVQLSGNTVCSPSYEQTHESLAEAKQNRNGIILFFASITPIYTKKRIKLFIKNL